MAVRGLAAAAFLSVAASAAELVEDAAAGQTPAPPGPTPCNWEFDDVHVKYDLTSIAGELVQYTTQGYAFQMTFCGFLQDQSCPNTPTTSSLVRFSSGGSCLYSNGRADNVTAAPAADPFSGLTLTYYGGPPCGTYAANTKQTSLQLVCDNTVPAGTAVVREMPARPTSCIVSFTVATPAACGIQMVVVERGVGAGWIVFLVLLGLAAAYLVGGVLYKRRKYGASGVEAIPNIDMWRAVGRCDWEGVKAAVRGGGAAGSDDYKLVAGEEGAGAGGFEASSAAHAPYRDDLA